MLQQQGSYTLYQQNCARCDYTHQQSFGELLPSLVCAWQQTLQLQEPCPSSLTDEVSSMAHLPKPNLDAPSSLVASHHQEEVETQTKQTHYRRRKYYLPTVSVMMVLPCCKALILSYVPTFCEPGCGLQKVHAQE